MTDHISLTDWLKAQTDTFETKKRMLVFTDLIHKPTGEKVVEGFRYFHAGIDELVAAFDADDVAAIRDLEYAIDEDGDVDTSAVCLLVAYTPTIIQAQQLRQRLDESGFELAQTLEVLNRTWNIDGMSVRPDHRMVAHTGFLTHARLLGT